MNIKRVFELPPNAEMIEPPITQRVGHWAAMTYDAKTVRWGVTWLRVKDGMGDRGDREDWVADVPGVSISVHDYHWNGDSFGPNYGTFDNACYEELAIMCARMPQKLKDARLVVSNLETTETILKSAIDRKF